MLLKPPHTGTEEAAEPAEQQEARTQLETFG